MFKTNQTVDGILAAFSRTIEDLTALAELNRAKAQTKSDQADKLIDESLAAKAEAERATAVAANLRGIIDAK